MLTVRAKGLIVCAATAVLAGCAGVGLSAQSAPGPGSTLQGSWKLNRDASEDPQKVLDKMRAEAMRQMARARSRAQAAMADNGPGGPGGGSGGRGRRGGTNGQDTQGMDEGPEDFGQQPPGPGRPPADPLRNSPTAQVVRATLERGDFLTIRETSEQVVFDYGGTVRRFTPGAHSVVSVQNGVADQTSGWKGRQYVIQVKPQMGPSVTEEYSLSPDGKRLIAKLHIGSSELPAVDLTRVYDPTTELAPSARSMHD